MSRNGSGTYTLPAGNPVVTGTTIESNWANTTLSDIATTLTDSLSRSGQGGMTAALRIADGTQGAPGVGFANETGSGFYRAGTGEVWAVVQGAQTLNLDASGVTVPVDKATSIEGTFVFNETGADKDARFEGDTDANLLFLDASTDRVGVGTNTPDAKLTVNGVGAFGDGAVGAPSIANTGDLNTGIWFPAADTVAVSTGGVEAARFDAAGNLGLGVTPRAWSAIKALQTGTAASFGGGSGYNDAFVTSNAFYDGTNWKYINSNPAYYASVGGTAAARWYTAPSGTAGNAISFTQSMTLDASGNLILGTTSGSNRLVVTGADSSTGGVSITGTGTGGLKLYYDHAGGGNAYINNTQNGFMWFGTNNTERARITSGGEVLIGATASAAYFDGKLNVAGRIHTKIGNAADSNHVVWNEATSGDNGFVIFGTETTFTSRGSIDYNRAGGLVRYNTTSDYRAKDIIGPVQNVGATIDALKVYEGKMKGATQSRPMLIAHEAQAHAPYAVSGIKDEVNEDGTPKFQQMDVSSLVPLLLAEIQSLRARVAALEAQP